MPLSGAAGAIVLKMRPPKFLTLRGFLPLDNSFTRREEITRRVRDVEAVRN